MTLPRSTRVAYRARVVAGWIAVCSALGAVARGSSTAPTDGTAATDGVAGTDGVAPTRQDSVDDLAKEFGKLSKGRTPADAIPVLDSLMDAYERSDEKDRKKIVQAVEGGLKARKDMEEGVDAMFVASAAALSAMGPMGDDALVRSLKLKHLRARPKVLATMVESLGQQARVEVLPSLLEHTQPDDKYSDGSVEVSAAALRALRKFRGATGKVRKEIVGKLVDQYEALDQVFEAGRKKGSPRPEVDHAFQTLEVPFLQVLQELTGQNERSAPAWREWWTAHAKDEWDDGSSDRDEEKSR